MNIILQIVHRKVWSIGGTGGAPLWYIKESIWTHSNPHEPTKNHQIVSRYLKISQASSSTMQSHAESTMWYQMVIIDQYWSFICLVISIELFWGYGIPIITNLNHMYILINHYNSYWFIIYHGLSWPLQNHCTWVHNRPSGISHRCLLSQKVLAECVPEMYEAQGVQGGSPLWYIWEPNQDQ